MRIHVVAFFRRQICQLIKPLRIFSMRCWCGIDSRTIRIRWHGIWWWHLLVGFARYSQTRYSPDTISFSVTKRRCRRHYTYCSHVLLHLNRLHESFYPIKRGVNEMFPCMKEEQANNRYPKITAIYHYNLWFYHPERYKLHHEWNYTHDLWPSWFKMRTV